jgi:hypothetical protein
MCAMINKNIDMIERMVNLFDYEEYVSLCEKSGVPSNTLNRFCTGVGMLSVARNKYPDLDWQEAYLKIMVDMNVPEELQKKEENGCCLSKEKKDEKPLGILDTAKNLVKSTTEHITKGLSHVSPEEYVRRITICKDCEWIQDGFQCGQCHCFMNVKAGWDVKNSCKLNKW